MIWDILCGSGIALMLFFGWSLCRIGSMNSRMEEQTLNKDNYAQ